MSLSSRRLGVWIVGGGLVGFGLAVCDRPAPAAWIAYLVIGIVAGIACGWIWRQIVGDEPARGLLMAFVIGLFLRLAVGLAWVPALPVYGNDVAHHSQGFFFPDAFERDRSAWAIGRTETSLLDSFDSAKGGSVRHVAVSDGNGLPGLRPAGRLDRVADGRRGSVRRAGRLLHLGFRTKGVRGPSRRNLLLGRRPLSGSRPVGVAADAGAVHHDRCRRCVLRVCLSA